MSNINNRKPFSQHGFSLLEILVAFAILSIFLGVLLNIFAGGVRSADVTGQYARAVQLAESLLASAGHEVPLEAKVMDGVSDEVYRWRMVIEPYTPPDPNWRPEKSPLQAYWVGVTINWGASMGERKFALSTLRLASKPRDRQNGQQ